MKFTQGLNRNQINLFPSRWLSGSLDQSIDPENEVRMIDLFVDNLSIKDYGLRMDFIENGRPAYHLVDLLKLLIYGYLNRVRFSRCQEKECHRNIEVMWLLKCLKPDHKTISNFYRIGNILTRDSLRKSLRILVSLFFLGKRTSAESNIRFGEHFLRRANFRSEYSGKAGNSLKKVKINSLKEINRQTAVSYKTRKAKLT